MTAIPPDLARWTGDRRQLASVRRIVLDEGPERGVAALAFSTGGGLDFWVLADRAMDIGPLWFRGLPIAWQSPAGFRHPAFGDPDSEDGTGFSRQFSGFLQTCGLDHTRQPLAGKPLHGRLPFLPARATACGERWDGPEPHLFAEGEIVQWRHGHEHLALVRRIEAPIGGATLRIRDRVENRGAFPQRHALLYHLNTGFPFLRSDARLTLDGQAIPTGLDRPDTGQAPRSDCIPAKGRPRAGAVLESAGVRMTLAFGTDTLPFLQHWRDPRPGMYVLALEPCTSARPEPGTLAEEPMLAPGEARSYEIDIVFEDDGKPGS